MLDLVIRLSLRYRAMVMVAALIVMVYGSYLATTLPVDVFPDLDRPRVVLLTECPGYSPEDIEALVAQPIETAILGAPGVQAVRSQSSQGLVVTYVEFNWQMETRYARQIVQERLNSISSVIPPNIRPMMTPPSSIMVSPNRATPRGTGSHRSHRINGRTGAKKRGLHPPCLGNSRSAQSAVVETRGLLKPAMERHNQRKHGSIQNW